MDGAPSRGPKLHDTPAALVALATLASVGAASSAAMVDPPANDYLLHGQMIARALSTLRDFGWAAFQDPWFPELEGGYPLFHHYPHLPHQWTAALALLLRVDPWTALSAANLLAVLLLPCLVWAGGRMLGLSSLAAALAALVMGTARCLDGFGHTPLEYGLMGHGLFGQLWGMAFASLAFPAWVAASLPDGAGLGRIPSWARVLLAGLLASLVVRSSVPAAFLLGICSALTVAAAGPARGLPRRAALYCAAGAIALVLSAGFVLPFLLDGGATGCTALVPIRERGASVGAVLVLRRLASGFYLDGGVPGPWSLLLHGTILGVLGARLAGRTVQPLLVGLALSAVLSVLLLFGRATWGAWVGRVPLLGSFHDHRYLLGLHLVAPWLVGAGLAALAEHLARGRRRAWGALPIVTVAAIALVPQVRQSRRDRETWAATLSAFDGVRADLDLLASRAVRSGGPVALGMPDDPVGGTTRLAWLGRQGLPAFGVPLHHYSRIYEFAVYWTRWAAGQEQQPVGVEVADLAAAGVTRILGEDATGDLGPPAPGAVLVRSDLLVHTRGCDQEGIAIRWFQEGLHRRWQYPTLDVGTGPRVDPRRYARTTALVDRDVAALRGLPDGGGIGTILADAKGERPGDRQIRARVDGTGTWLMVAQAWHPRWRVTVDGEQSEASLLVPGWIGIPLLPGEHEVTLAWRPASWRGPWAAASTAALVLALLAVAIGALRRTARALPPFSPPPEACRVL